MRMELPACACPVDPPEPGRSPPGSLSLQPVAMSQPGEEGLEVHKQLMRQMLVWEWRRWSETLSSPSAPSEPVPTQLLV